MRAPMLFPIPIGVANDEPGRHLRRVGRMPYRTTLDGQMSRKAQYVQAR